MINLFLILIIISAFVCILTVIIGIKSQKTFYPVVSVCSGVLIIAFALCCVIEADSTDSDIVKEMPSKAYIPVSENSEIETEKKTEASSKKQDDNNNVDTEDAEEIISAAESIPHDMGSTVYITKTGTKYHYSYFCSDTDFYECTLEQALSRGLEPCQKCVSE